MKQFLSFFLPLAALATAWEEQQPLQQPVTPKPAAIEGIPLIGFGTWNLKTNCSQAVSQAIVAGYRHIDCAAIYDNEQEVGAGIADGLAKTGLRREDLWITSKLWNDHHGIGEVGPALHKTLRNLGISYLDLYHMHWPVSSTIFGGHIIDYRDTWAAMHLMQTKGLTRYIGVSNFSPRQLEDLLNNTDFPPAVHQMELHPYLQQSEWVEWHTKHGIHVTAYSPLAGTNPTYGDDDDLPVALLQNKVIKKIAEERECTPAQVVLAWGMHRGTSVIPKSSHVERVKENLWSVECELTKKDFKKIRELGEVRYRFNNPSESWGVRLYEGLEDSEGRHKKHS